MKKWLLIIIALLIFVGILLFLRTTQSKTCDPSKIHGTGQECYKSCVQAGCDHGYADGTSKCAVNCGLQIG